ncbi:unnamed protein product [Moneuplotes crassus]|uniref:FLYWCH-type domain-containing protein n=1 Tax=Euplotes crassus TaxID=5936 RepID=A0AAD1TZV1_EUPCR|nr:unnamed protein product [Moneuplotes crassus]
MVKLKFQTKGRLLPNNPRNFYELVTSIYKYYPEIYNIEDYSVYFHDQDNERSVINQDDDLQAAYKLMALKKGPILIFFIENRRARKNALGDRRLDSKSVQEVKLRNKKKEAELLENALLVRNGYTYEFSRTSRNAYCYRCEDWKKGCKGKWYLFEKDSNGLGIEHSAHSLLKEEHSCMEISRELGNLAMEVSEFIDMKGDLPFIVKYDAMKKKSSTSCLNLISDLPKKCLGTDWNLLGKRLLENLINKLRSRLSVKSHCVSDISSIKTVEGEPFCREVIECNANNMKQYLCFFYSDFQVKLLQEAKTLYISGSHKKWLKPQWSETVFIQAFKNKTCVTLCTFITQSDSDEAFKAGLSYLQKELDLSPEEVVLDPQANLTSAAIGVFGNDTKYKTCSYFFHNYLNQRADRLCLLNQNEDHNVKKLLWCLKALAFKPKSDIEGDFIKIQNFYKRFCCSYEQITDEFYNLFVRKLNLDYWNSNYMFKEDRERKAKYLELNRILEIHDMLLEKYLDETETFSSFCKGLAELERKFRMILEENDHIEVSNDDLDETNILADLLDQKFNIEMVMSHSFQLPHRENSMIGSSIESNFGVSPLANNPNANNVGVPNFNPYNANVGGGMNLSKRRGRRPSANIHHLAQNGTPVSQQPYTDSRENRLNPFPSNFVS